MLAEEQNLFEYRVNSNFDYDKTNQYKEDRIVQLARKINTKLVLYINILIEWEKKKYISKNNRITFRCF